MKDGTTTPAIARVARESPVERQDVTASTEERAIAVLARVLGLQAESAAAGITSVTVAG